MTHNIVHIDAGEEELVKDCCAKIFRLEILFHARQAGHKAVEESVFERVASYVLSKHSQNPHKAGLVLGFCCLKCILHC